MSYDGRTRVLIMAAPERNAVDLIMRDIPALKVGEALVKVRYAGICGTDLHIISWNDWAARSYAPPFALGHELCGEIVDLSPNDHFKVGDRVSAETHWACGNCYQCRVGRGHTCDNLKTFSKLDQGAFADYSVIPLALLRKVPAEISDQTASVMEPIGISMRTASNTICSGGSVFISGCGPIGLFAVAAVKHLGARQIIVSDPMRERRDIAMALGADVTLNPTTEPVSEIVMGCCDGLGAHSSIETSGDERALAEAFKATRKGGKVITAGLPSSDVSIDLTGQIVLREIGLSGIYGRLLDHTWVETEAALSSGLGIEAALTHRYFLEDFENAFATAKSGKSGKILFNLSDP